MSGTLPAPRVNMAMVYIPQQDSVVAFGGHNGRTFFADCYVLTLDLAVHTGRWSRIELAPAPSSPCMAPICANLTARGAVSLGLPPATDDIAPGDHDVIVGSARPRLSVWPGGDSTGASEGDVWPRLLLVSGARRVAATGIWVNRLVTIDLSASIAV